MPRRELRKPPPKTFAQVAKRVSYLRNLNEPYLPDRSRIRALMNGGRGALEVLLKDLPPTEETLPAANHIRSGVERFSEMISPTPDLRVDPPQHTDKTKPREQAEKRERIVTSYDERCKLDQQIAQGSLWAPGYGFFSWKVCERRDRAGNLFPKAELRDPFTTWPAEWGVDQDPVDIAYQRFVNPDLLIDIYPHAKAGLTGLRRLPGGGFDLSGLGVQHQRPGWDGQSGGVEVIEYVDSYGTYVYSPAIDGFLDVFEHPLDRPPFVVPRRFTFDTLTGQFSDVIGLASTMAKLTLLTQIIMEDAAFAPLVVTGRMDGPFRKGRDAVNLIEGGDAKYVQQNIPYQMFTEIDRIESHLRSTTGYSKQADGESPISFVTGQGLEELGSSLTRQVERYQLSFSSALTELDAIRLEWDERAYGGQMLPLEGYVKGSAYAEEYDPAVSIDGQYRTRRVYGLMAAWDDARKLVGGLQLLSAGAIDLTTLRENLRGIDNIPQIEERTRKDKAENVLFEGMLAAASQGDPNAQRLAFEVHKTGDLDKALEEFYAAQEEMAAEEAAAPPEAPPDLATAMSMLRADGSAEGTARTVAPMGA